MTPRQFVESLRKPLSLAYEDRSTSIDAARLAEIDGWLWAEEKWPTWGEGGKAFVLRARAAVKTNDFIPWLDSLPPMKEAPLKRLGGGKP